METYFPSVLGILDGLFGRFGPARAPTESQLAIPVVITPLAATQIAAQGLEHEVEVIFDYTRRIIRQLHSIEVLYYPEPDDLGHFPYPFGIVAWVDESDQVLTSVWARWMAWRSWRFPGRIQRLFGISIFYRSLNLSSPVRND
jgi:hypothetical protein